MFLELQRGHWYSTWRLDLLFSKFLPTHFCSVSQTGLPLKGIIQFPNAYHVCIVSRIIGNMNTDKIQFWRRLEWWRIHLQCGRPRFDPWVGKILWRRAWQPTPVFFPGESHGQRSLVGYSPYVAKSWTQLSNSAIHPEFRRRDKNLKMARLQAKASPSPFGSLPRSRRCFSKSWVFYSLYSVIGSAPKLTFRDEGASELSCAGKGNWTQGFFVVRNR